MYSDHTSNMAAPQTRIIDQHVLDEHHPSINVQILLESALTAELIESLFAGGATTTSDPSNRRVGLAPAYTTSGNLTALAIGTARKILVVQFHAKRRAETNKAGRELLQAAVLCNPDCTVYTFDLAPLAAAMYYDHRLRLVNAVNIGSACAGTGDDSPLAAIQFAVGDKVTVIKENVTRLFNDLVWDQRRTTPLVLRAWVAHYVSGISDMEEKFREVKRVNTKDMNDVLLELISQLARGDQEITTREDAMVNHEFTTNRVRQDTSSVNATRFQTRFRKSNDIRATVKDKNGAEYIIPGKVHDVMGRTADIKTAALLDGKSITSMITIDGNRPTYAGRQKAAAILHVLQGEDDLFKNPFLNYMFLPSDSFTWPETFISSPTIPSISFIRPLNPSQQEAVEHMLTMANDHYITVIQGPPGTGKTTVIAAFVCSSVTAGVGGIWLAAQSNVAVKNIAEKLADVGFMDWKLLVSADFELGWHDHLYHKISRNVIRSTEFKSAQKHLQGCSVVLCTLAMLSNPRVKKFLSIVPMTTLVIDEASQITVSDYIPPLSNFPTIRKLCFIGDDKQLPPYGQDENEERKSVFEVPHLRSLALFLDTQYRMPPQIGEFISDAVYDGQLQSNPLHPVPISDKLTACYFIDLACKLFSLSLYNDLTLISYLENNLERQAVLKIASRLQTENKNYRIITPYDAQRSALEDDMKKAGMPWEDKCFNVDSFQGNEEDYIIISLRGMFVCSSWNFVFGIALNSLVGRMASQFGDHAWIGMRHLEEDNYQI
ncbi:P-loop containing nucleoside triphosphate hydrolase protein [Sparassis latifolia]